MSDSQSTGNGTGPRRRRGKRFLSPSEKYEIWISLIRGEYTIVQAAEQAGVDRSTIMKLRAVARQGALEALAASKPGVRAGTGPDPELAAAKAEIARLSEALKEIGVRLMLAEASPCAVALSARARRSGPPECYGSPTRTPDGWLRLASDERRDQHAPADRHAAGCTSCA